MSSMTKPMKLPVLPHLDILKPKDVQHLKKMQLKQELNAELVKGFFVV